jgi:hypothetical protein
MMDPDAVRLVNRFLMDVIRSESHRDVLEGERAHPLLQERLRQVADMDVLEREGAITIQIDDRGWRFEATHKPNGPAYRMSRRTEIWQVNVRFLAPRQVELTAEPTASI